MTTDLETLAAAWAQAGDRRSLFAHAYAAMTSAMRSGIGSGEFRDRDWVNRLIEVFMGYYLRAADDARAGRLCPTIWAEAFAACDREDENPLTLVMLGINAHINHDLVFALRDVLDDWPALDEMARAGRYADYTEVNHVIARSIDGVQDLVLDPALPAFELIDASLGRADEWAFTRLVSRWRQEVWEDSVRLLGAATDEELQQISTAVDERARRTARLIGLL